MIFSPIRIARETAGGGNFKVVGDVSCATFSSLKALKEQRPVWFSLLSPLYLIRIYKRLIINVDKDKLGFFVR